MPALVAGHPGDPQIDRRPNRAGHLGLAGGAGRRAEWPDRSAWRQVELSTGSRAPAETPRPAVSPCWGGLTVPRPQRGAIFCKGFLPVVQLIEFRGEP